MAYLPCANWAGERKARNLGISGLSSLDNPVNMPVDKFVSLWTGEGGRAWHAHMLHTGV